MLRDVVGDAGHPGPDRAARTLMVLRDGAMLSGCLDDHRDIGDTLRETAENLLNA
ncbi:hypothetical protein [Streptomyces sp. S465]|uniref:hypothetical protein n=1 Tax=Streptomyces sp. S465 TaxID=2979468 RepID=UPI0022A8A36B|nr:hypothetical protein [Streptomyces sp. S465]WAP60092.1 hypothetical protein N6H00_36900 [Streptomyces sp. S465]